ncbi:MAG: hypothetical protein J5930_08510 [Treponema sp.]|nr:hypothetical protein [Treponema sp.]
MNKTGCPAPPVMHIFFIRTACPLCGFRSPLYIPLSGVPAKASIPPRCYGTAKAAPSIGRKGQVFTLFSQKKFEPREKVKTCEASSACDRPLQSGVAGQIENQSPVAKNAGIYRSVLKFTALPAEFVPSDGVTGAAQSALYGSVKSAGLSVMPVAKCPLSRPLPPFRGFQKQLFILHSSTIVSWHF